MKTVSRLNLSLISKLRKETNVPLHRAKQALIESPDYEAALKYLQNDPQVLKTALKLSDRPTFQGLISVLSGLNTVAMVQVNSETDFVSKNEIFIKFVDRVTISTLLAGEFDKSKILELPCLDTDADLDLTKTPSSIGDELVQAVGSVGENIAILRGIVLNRTSDNMFLGKYCHGSVNKHMGRIGAVCVVSVDCKMDMLKILKLDSILQTMSDKIAQHIVACSPVTIQKDSETSLDRPCLLEQDWFFGTGSVQDMLNVFESEYKVKVKVDRFKRYEVGEDFSEEQTKI